MKRHGGSDSIRFGFLKQKGFGRMGPETLYVLATAIAVVVIVLAVVKTLRGRAASIDEADAAIDDE